MKKVEIPLGHGLEILGKILKIQIKGEHVKRLRWPPHLVCKYDDKALVKIGKEGFSAEARIVNRKVIRKQYQ